MSLKDKNETKFSYASIYRGNAFFLDGRVHIHDYSDTAVRAKVNGLNGTYTVGITFSKDGRMIGNSCSCPAYRRNNAPCKHVYATLCAASAIRDSIQSLATPTFNAHYSEVCGAEKALLSLSFYTDDPAYVCSLVSELLNSLKEKASPEGYQCFIQTTLTAMATINARFLLSKDAQQLFLKTIHDLSPSSTSRFLYSLFVGTKEPDTLAALIRMVSEDSSLSPHLPGILKKNVSLWNRTISLSENYPDIWDWILSSFSDSDFTSFIHTAKTFPEGFATAVRKEATRRGLSDIVSYLFSRFPDSFSKLELCQEYFALREKNDKEGLFRFASALLSPDSSGTPFHVLLGLAALPPDSRISHIGAIRGQKKWYSLEGVWAMYAQTGALPSNISQIRTTVLWYGYAFFGQELIERKDVRLTQKRVEAILEAAIQYLEYYEISPELFLFLFLKTLDIYSKVYPEIQNSLQNPSIQELSYQSTRARWMYLDFIRRHPGYSPTREF
ncbi:MAG: SWIM zinc finger family protein [Candidatus Enteromonas sp.]|nr:SWIM zinc finger family protein [Candidatus Enteromonas sp.]